MLIGADRRVKLLIHLAVQGSLLDACSQGMSAKRAVVQFPGGYIAEIHSSAK
jgi:hypothetical protein